MEKGMALRGVSYVLPERVETNEDLVKDFKTWTVEKIYKKTGIRQRPIADPNEPVSASMIRAGRKFFAQHPDVALESIDMLLLCSEARDYVLPSTACVVHHALGLRTTSGALGFDLGCSGYVYGLALCKGFIAAGIARRVLLLTGDKLTWYINEMDRSVRTIFGDGFTASLLEACDHDEVTGFDLGTDGSGARDIIIEAGETAMPYSSATALPIVNRFGNVHTLENLFMDGRKVLDFAVKQAPQSMARTLAATGLSMDDVDLVVPHQASMVVLEQLRGKLGLDEEKFVIDLEETGNTASSSIPLVLARLAERGKLKEGMKILITGFGVGLSWGSALIRWHR
ncbi:MAG: 3-oxoacyl-ACP synthase III family protein [Pyramidobacter sp.]|jgi:3-oxoacyl-[acyl-carrier-protein] synthase-3